MWVARKMTLSPVIVPLESVVYQAMVDNSLPNLWQVRRSRPQPPQNGGMVLAAGGQPPSIGAELHGVHVVLVSGESLQQPAIAHLPEADGLTFAAGGLGA